MKESITSSSALKSAPVKALSYSMTMKLTITSAGFDAAPRGLDSDSACGVASGVGVAAGFGE